MRYRLTYTVLADSWLQAIFKADALLRTGVTAVALVECEQSVPGWWDVVLDVEETRPEPVCPVCRRRPADTPVVVDGERVELCATCWQRRDRELEGSWA